MNTNAHHDIARLERGLTRAVIIAMALGTALVGASLLTTPLAIPLTVGLWTGAAGMLALGLWGRLPTDV